MSKTTQTLKQATRFSLLLAFREAYIYLRNLFGLTQHPYLTIKRIFKEKDRSQLVLVFGLPFYLLLTGIIFIFAVKKLIFGHVFGLGFLAKTGLFFLALISLILFIYLAYWLIQIWKYRGKNA